MTENKWSNFSGILQGLGIGLDTLDVEKSGFLSGALQGAGAGASFGPIGALGGAVIGGAFNYFNKKAVAKRNAEDIKARSIQKEFYRKENAKAHMRAVLNTFPTNGVNSSGFYQFGLSGI